MTKTTPILTMTPDFTPVIRMMALQTRIAAQSGEAAMRLAYLPWKSWNAGVEALSLSAKQGTKAMATQKPVAGKAAKRAEKTIAVAPAKPEVVAKPVTKPGVAPKVVEPAVTAAPKPAAKTDPIKTPAKTAQKAPVKAVEPAPVKAKPAVTKPVEKPVVAAVASPKAVEAPKTVEKAAAPKADKPVAKAVTPEAAPAKAAETAKPAFLKAARNGKADDLTQLKGVGPKLALTLQEAGIFHYDQIAGWTDVQTAWVDDNIAGVRGRASRNGWVKQAQSLAKA